MAALAVASGLAAAPPVLSLDPTDPPPKALRELAAALLDPDRPAPSLGAEVLALATLAGGRLVDRSSDLAAGETWAADGLALSPSAAALCAEDPVRVVAFARGAQDAVRAARSRSHGPVRLLYAGCGPYALLALPLMAVLGPEAVRVTLLDLHPASIASARAVVARLGLAACVEAAVVADATRVVLDPERRPDVVLTETMQACLAVEPQVAVTRHLLRQAPGALVVPNHIQVDLGLADPAVEFGGGPGRGRSRVFVGAVFALNAEAVAHWGDAPGPLPAATVRLPRDDRPPFLFTTVRTFGNHLLRTHESGLTAPRLLSVDGAGPGDRVRFEYVTGARPGLRGEVLPGLAARLRRALRR